MKETWIVIDHEGTFIFSGSYDEAKKVYDSEVEGCKDAFSDDYFLDDEVGFKAIMAKVENALSLYHAEDDKGNEYLELDHLMKDGKAIFQ